LRATLSLFDIALALCFVIAKHIKEIIGRHGLTGLLSAQP
jgi:hypothetical protein